MVIDVEQVENSFSWETFKDGLPYLGTYKNEIPGIAHIPLVFLRLKRSLILYVQFG